MTDTQPVDLTHPARPLVSDGMAAVVVTLAGTARGLSGRTVARLSGLSHSGAHRVLTTLQLYGLVETETVGAAILYRLNRSHVLVPPLLQLVSAGDEVRLRIGERIGSWSVQPDHASIFGSVARDEATPLSDIDLLVVRGSSIPFDDPTWRSQLMELGDDVREWTGQSVSWLEFTSEEIAAAAKAGELIVSNWKRDGVLISGDPIAEVLRHAA